MKATFRGVDDCTGYPLGDVDVLQVEEYRRALAALMIYDGDADPGTREITVQINHEERCLDFVWAVPDAP